MDYDVLIVGAGPAGVSAAFDLCSLNKNVLLLDKHYFPRKKACAAGLTVKTVNALRYSIDPVIKHVSHNFAAVKKSRSKKILRSKTPLCYMSERFQLDHFCLEKAKSMGAAFRKVSKILNITEHRDHVLIETTDGSIKSKYLIGADGCNSRVRKLTGEIDSFYYGLAVEGIIRTDNTAAFDMEFDFGAVQSGYGWVFPKDDHINIGLYTSSPHVQITKKMLLGYGEKRMPGCSIQNICGDPMSFGGWGYKPENHRILLAGDAAGFIDPLTGEGLYNAIRSGQLAAEAVHLAEVNGYAGQYYGNLIKEITTDLKICKFSADKFYRHLDLGYHILKSYPAATVLMRGFSKGLTLKQSLKQCYKLML